MPQLAPEMRAKLAEAALRLFATRGIGNVSLDAVASSAGVTKGSVYWHYKSRKEVILAACNQYYRQWQRKIHAELARSQDPRDRLRRAVVFVVNSCIIQQSSRVFTTEVAALALHDTGIRAGWVQFNETARELFLGLAEAARSAGQIHPADTARAVDLMLAALEGVKQKAAFVPEVAAVSEREALVEELMRLIGGEGPAA